MERTGRSDNQHTSQTDPKVFGNSGSTGLGPVGQIESTGDFARGLGRRKARILLVVLGAILVISILASVGLL